MRTEQYFAEEYHERDGCGIAFLKAACILGLLIMLYGVVGCKSSAPLVQKIERIERDTIRTTDSVYIDRWRNVYRGGDTVYIERVQVETHYKFRDRVQKVEVRDSIPYEVHVIEYVRRRNAYDKATSTGFWVMLIGLIVIIAIRIWFRLKH